MGLGRGVGVGDRKEGVTCRSSEPCGRCVLSHRWAEFLGSGPVDPVQRQAWLAHSSLAGRAGPVDRVPASTLHPGLSPPTPRGAGKGPLECDPHGGGRHIHCGARGRRPPTHGTVATAEPEPQSSRLPSASGVHPPLSPPGSPPGQEGSRGPPPGGGQWLVLATLRVTDSFLALLCAPLREFPGTWCSEVLSSDWSHGGAA